jgi:hypothetical protein
MNQGAGAVFLRVQKGGKEMCEEGAVSGSPGEELKEVLALDRGLRRVVV